MRPPRFDTAQLSLVRAPFDHPDFVFELKHDGFRALAHIWNGKCELSRKRNAYKSFQDLRANLVKLKVNNAVLDGEIVCLDSEGRSIFNELFCTVLGGGRSAMIVPTATPSLNSALDMICNGAALLTYLQVEN
jgi:ATP-dependent DNA ligase